MKTFYYKVFKQQYLRKKLLYSDVIHENIDTKNLHEYLLNQGCKVPVTLSKFRLNVRSAFENALEMDWEDAPLEYIVDIKDKENPHSVSRYVVIPV